MLLLLNLLFVMNLLLGLLLLLNTSSEYTNNFVKVWCNYIHHLLFKNSSVKISV